MFKRLNVEKSTEFVSELNVNPWAKNPIFRRHSSSQVKCNGNFSLSVYFGRWEKLSGRECPHVATSTAEKISWKNTRRNKFNIDQTFSNYLYFSGCACVCAMMLSKYWYSAERKPHSYQTQTHTYLSTFSCRAKTGGTKYMISAHNNNSNNINNELNKYVIRNNNVYSSLFHSVIWETKRKKRNCFYSKLTHRWPWNIYNNYEILSAFLFVATN